MLDAFGFFFGEEADAGEPAVVVSSADADDACGLGEGCAVGSDEGEGEEVVLRKRPGAGEEGAALGDVLSDEVDLVAYGGWACFHLSADGSDDGDAAAGAFEAAVTFEAEGGQGFRRFDLARRGGHAGGIAVGGGCPFQGVRRAGWA